MSQSQTLWLFYAAILLLRIRATGKRLRLPMIRGQEYFFNVHVGPDFYTGPGRPIFAAYRRWVLLPFLPDLLAVPAILATNRTDYLTYLLFGGMIFGMATYLRSATRATREAKRFAIDSPAPVAQVALSLTPRRVSDYTNWKIEAILAVLTLGSSGAIAWAWLEMPDRPAALQFFRVPILIVYVQLGALMLKRAIVAWRTPAPADDAESYLAWKEALRRRYLFICDVVRLAFVSTLVIAALAMYVPLEGGSARTFTAIATLMLMGVWTVWYGRYAKSALQSAISRKPVNFPYTPDAEELSGMWCYRPATPLSFIRTPRGYTMNLASLRTQLGLLYLCGLLLLIFRV
jgi:hypothetical protein